MFSWNKHEFLLGVYVVGEPGEEQAAAIASVAQGGTLTLDPNIQYQFRADTGQG